MSSFIPVLTIGIVLDSFYLLVFYSEKFSAWVWILPFAVNVNLNLSIPVFTTWSSAQAIISVLSNIFRSMQWFLILYDWKVYSVHLKQILLFQTPRIKIQQISIQNRLRKRNGNDLTRQRKRRGNKKQCLNFHLTRFPSKQSCGNATGSWIIRFPPLLRIAETPYFTLWTYSWSERSLPLICF